MENNLIYEDIQRFKSIIDYNPSYGLINENVPAEIINKVLSKTLKIALDDFIKNTLKIALKDVGTKDITLYSKNKITSQGKKLIDDILKKNDAVLKNGANATFDTLDEVDKMAAQRIAKEAQMAIDKKVINKLGGNVTRETISNAFVAMTKSANLTEESIQNILNNIGKPDLFKALSSKGISGNNSRLLLNDVSQSLFKKPYLSLQSFEREALSRTINSMNRKKLRKELAQKLISQAPEKVSKLKKLWNRAKRIPTSKILKWSALTLLSVASIWAIIHYWDEDVTKEDEDEKKIDDGGGGGGGGNGGGGGGSSTTYTQCSDFPYKKNCSSSIVAEVQKCLGLYNDGKFGPKTEAKLNQLGYGSEITKEVYDKIKEKCGTNTVTEPIKVNPEYVDPNKIIYTDTEFNDL